MAESEVIWSKLLLRSKSQRLPRLVQCPETQIVRALDVGRGQIDRIRRITQETSELLNDMSIERLRGIAGKMPQQSIGAAIGSERRRRFEEGVRQRLFGCGRAQIADAIDVGRHDGVTETIGRSFKFLGDAGVDVRIIAVIGSEDASGPSGSAAGTHYQRDVDRLPRS